MHLSLSDPAFTERLVSFFESLGQTVRVHGPGRIELENGLDQGELGIYLRVWQVLHPDAEVTVEA